MGIQSAIHNLAGRPLAYKDDPRDNVYLPFSRGSEPFEELDALSRNGEKVLVVYSEDGESFSAATARITFWSESSPDWRELEVALEEAPRPVGPSPLP